MLTLVRSLLLRSRYADHVGIHYVLCTKLRQFPYEDIEFFLPQLCHLIISVDNESMALEEFLLDLCEESVTAALLVRLPPEIRAMSLHVRHADQVSLPRPFGYSRPTCTISRRTLTPKPSALADGSTIRSSTSSSGCPNLDGTKRSRRMCFL